jgi:hypothetical protein
VWHAERRPDLGDLGDGARDRERLLAGFPVELGPGLQDRDGDTRSQREHDDRDLEQEDLRRQTQATPTPPPFPRHEWKCTTGNSPTFAASMDKTLSTAETAKTRRNRECGPASS